MLSVHHQIETIVKQSQQGSIFFVDDFVGVGAAENVKKILLRLHDEGLLERIAHGIYLKPKMDALIGKIYPSTEDIAQEIARRDHARIAATGALALYLLHLTTQIPLKAVYLTDGAQREVKIGNQTIKFKRTVPKNLSISDPLLHLVIQAFREKGKGNVDGTFLTQIHPHILNINKANLENELKFAPVWIREEIEKLKNEECK